MEYNEIVIPSVTGVITAFIGWVAGKRKEDAELKASDLDNVDKAVQIWQDLAEKMSNKVDALSSQVEALQKENLELRNIIADLKQKLDKFDENNQVQ